MRTALSAATLAALFVPVAVGAQTSARDVPFVQPVAPAQPQYPRRPVRPLPPTHRPPRPLPSLRPAHGAGHGFPAGRYPVVIDGSLIDRYTATPVPVMPVAKPAHRPTPRPKDAPDVFETHSTGNE